MKKTILLTGGAGYIGSHTAVELIEAGYDAVIADDLSNSRVEVIDSIEKITGVRPAFYKINVCDREPVEAVFAQRHIDAVIHFAGFKAVAESIEMPIKYYRNNMDSTLTLLETMGRHDCHVFVFSSSATVYGRPRSVPIPETAPVGDCFNPYGRTKYFIEHVLRDAAIADKNMSVSLLRYFNPIGAHESGLIGERPNGIPNNLMPYLTQVAAGIRDHLNVFGDDYPTHDGTGVRDYIHVVDLAKGHLAALDYAFGRTGTDVFNLGTGVGYSVLDIVHAFESANGVAVPYVIGPRRGGDVAECYADPAKASQLLGWRAEKGIFDMCRDSWRWQESCRDE